MNQMPRCGNHAGVIRCQDDGFGKGTPEQRSRGGEGKKAELKEAGNHRSFFTDHFCQR
jgi:hypothetical protein